MGKTQLLHTSVEAKYKQINALEFGQKWLIEDQLVMSLSRNVAGMWQVSGRNLLWGGSKLAPYK